MLVRGVTDEACAMAGEKDWAADKNEATEALDFPRSFGFCVCPLKVSQ